MEQMGFVGKLAELGVNGKMRTAIVGSVIGRMAKPASELATWQWLQRQSALGEMIDVDFDGQKDGRTLNVRMCTAAEPDLMNIYKALGLDPAPGGMKKMVV